MSATVNVLIEEIVYLIVATLHIIGVVVVHGDVLVGSEWALGEDRRFEAESRSY